MRYVLSDLDEQLSVALDWRLSLRGHQPARCVEEAELMIIALREPTEGRRVLDVGLDDWAAMIARVRTVFTSVRDHVSRLARRDQGGRVVVIVDPPAERAMEGAGLSGIAGAFLSTAVKVAALDTAGSGIGVNMVVAGWRPSAPTAFADGTPLGRLAEANEIAEACAFLADPTTAGFITGASLVVDGGWSLTRNPGRSPFHAPPLNGETWTYED